MNLKVALFVDTEMKNNAIFDPNSSKNRDNCLYPIQFLHKFLSDRGIEMQTYDIYEQRNECPDIYFFDNFSPFALAYIMRKKIKRSQMLLWANETQISLSNALPHRRFLWIFLEKFPTFFPIVLTHSNEFIDSRRFRKLIVPQAFFPYYRKFWEREKTLFSVIINSNKMSRSKGELFSLRREIIRFFEKYHPDFLDVYGIGWNKPIKLPKVNIWDRLFPSPVFYTQLYRGTCDSKLEILANYKFAICTQNHRYPNDICEKIFDALFAGSVPIYYGAPNISEYIPEDCFIDFGKFHNLEELFAFMQEIAGTDKLQQMRECGWQFLNSKLYTPFKIETFSEIVYKALIDLFNRNY